MAYDDIDERTLHAAWASRPGVGDTVELKDAPDFRGEVVATFYRNGEGGMHVKYPHGVSWTSCHRVWIVSAASKEKV